METRSTDGISINYGVDFERAKERLSHAAGKLFREYHAAKRDSTHNAEEIEHLRLAYVEVSGREKNLSRHNEAEIRAILGSPI